MFFIIAIDSKFLEQTPSAELLHKWQKKSYVGKVSADNNLNTFEDKADRAKISLIVF